MEKVPAIILGRQYVPYGLAFVVLGLSALLQMLIWR